MKFTSTLVVLAAALFSTVSAQGISDFPPCALSCLVKAIGATGCETTDFKCSCSKQQFVDDSAECIKGACSAEDAKKALEVAVALCKKAGVDIVLPGQPTSTAAPPPEPSNTASPPPPSGCKRRFRPRRV